MIELEVQFKIVIVSVLFSMLFTNLYTMINIMLRNSKVVRGIFELCFFLITSIAYYLIIYKINKGILNIYMPICLIFGWYIHMRFYDKYFSCLYKYIFSKFHSIIDKKRSKWYKLWKEFKRKKTKEVKLTE